MSYTPYTPTPPAGQTTTPSATYTYGTYPYSHPQTPGSYTYPAGAYQAGITGYGWTYPYSYVQQHPQGAVPQLPRAQGVQAPVTPYTPVTTPTPQRTTTFTAYAPNYAKENVSSSTHTATGRGGRRQPNMKGLFTKERKFNFFISTLKVVYLNMWLIHTVKNLMYGFGDDRNPSNDTVSVMEEILIEYITDVVRLFPPLSFLCTKLKKPPQTLVQCQAAAGPSRKSRLSIDDLRRVLSRPADAKKLARMEELLFMQEDIKRARAQFEESDIHNPKGL